MRAGIDYVGISVVFFCYDNRGRFLAGKRSANCRDETGKWDIGSGEVNIPEESPIQALKREIKEEYGIGIIKSEFLGNRYIIRKIDGETTKWLGIDFKVLVDANEIKSFETNKLEAIGWFTLHLLLMLMKHIHSFQYFWKNIKKN